MFSHNVPPPSIPTSCQHRPFHLTSCPRSISSAASVLPAGSCQFILLHPSIPGQRCSCQGFRRNESLPGALCECGHQACYHSYGNAAQPSPEDCAVPYASFLALMERIHRLEAQHEHDRRIWEEELKEERRARREDIRILREAMHAFYKFMEQDVPRKFDEVEDKIESVVDRQHQLQERMITVYDSTMALGDRVAELENEREYNQRVNKNRNEDEDENHESKSPRKRVNQTSTVDYKASASAEHFPAIHSADPVGAATPDSISSSSSPQSTSSSHSTPTPSRVLSPPHDRKFYHGLITSSKFVGVAAPIPIDCGHVRMLSSAPQNLILPSVCRAEITMPKRHSRAQSVTRGHSGIESHHDTIIKSQRAHSSSSNENAPSSPSPSSPSPRLSHRLLANGHRNLKRKRYGDKLQLEANAASRDRLSLPTPSPLSLSSTTDVDPLRCNITDVNREHTSSSFSSFTLTHRVEPRQVSSVQRLRLRFDSTNAQAEE